MNQTRFSAPDLHGKGPGFMGCSGQSMDCQIVSIRSESRMRAPIRFTPQRSAKSRDVSDRLALDRLMLSRQTSIKLASAKFAQEKRMYFNYEPSRPTFSTRNLHNRESNKTNTCQLFCSAPQALPFRFHYRGHST